MTQQHLVRLSKKKGIEQTSLNPDRLSTKRRTEKIRNRLDRKNVAHVLNCFPDRAFTLLHTCSDDQEDTYFFCVYKLCNAHTIFPDYSIQPFEKPSKFAQRFQRLASASVCVIRPIFFHPDKTFQQLHGVLHKSMNTGSLSLCPLPVRGYRWPWRYVLVLLAQSQRSTMHHHLLSHGQAPPIAYPNPLQPQTLIPPIDGTLQFSTQPPLTHLSTPNAA